MRQGKEISLHFDDIVVGDVVQIKQGMEVPVDGIVLRSSGVLTNESAMTGESREMKKEPLEVCKQRREEQSGDFDFPTTQATGGDKERSHRDLPSPILLSGTQITTGEGWFLVLVVGRSSCAGKIRAKLELDSDEMTPL
jgi:magnesium-transporting ATPase (P-type)